MKRKIDRENRDKKREDDLKEGEERIKERQDRFNKYKQRLEWEWQNWERQDRSDVNVSDAKTSKFNVYVSEDDPFADDIPFGGYSTMSHGTKEVDGFANDLGDETTGGQNETSGKKVSQDQLLQEIMAAASSGDLDLVRRHYEIGKKTLEEMPKVHDGVALLFYQNGMFEDAYESIRFAIVQNERRLKDDVAEAQYDLGLSHHNAATICGLARREFTRELTIHMANSVLYLFEAETLSQKGLSSSTALRYNWPSNHFGTFLPSHFLGEVWRMDDMSDLLHRLEISFKPEDRFAVSLSKHLVASYIIDRLSSPVSAQDIQKKTGNASGGKEFREWFSGTLRVYKNDTIKAISEINEALGEDVTDDQVSQRIATTGRELENLTLRVLKTQTKKDPDFVNLLHDQY